MMQFQHLFGLLLVLLYAQRIKSQALGCAKDIVFLADISGSVSAESEIGLLKAFLVDTITRFDIGNARNQTQVAVVKFETGAHRVIGLSSDKSEILKKVNNISATQGWTNYIEALDIATTILQYEDRNDTLHQDVVVLLTDGKPTRSANGTGIPDDSFSAADIVRREQMHKHILEQTKLLKDRNTKIIAISISTETDKTLLKQMISNATRVLKGKNSSNEEEPQGLYSADDFESLSNWTEIKRNQLVQNMCSPSTNKPDCTGGKIYVQCGKCSDRTCYNQDPVCTTVCEPKCVCPDAKPFFHLENCISKCPARQECLDVTFLVDTSGSVSNLQGNKIKTTRTYLHGLVDAMDIGSGTNQSRVAIITFETHAQQIADFSFSKQQLNDAIDTISDTQGWTNYFQAFQLANKVYQDVDRDDRVNPDFILLLTDGKPTITKQNETLPESDMSASAISMREQMHADIMAEVDNLKNHNSRGNVTIFVRRVGNNTDESLLRRIETTGQGHDKPLKSVTPLPLHDGGIPHPDNYIQFSTDMEAYISETLLLMGSKCGGPPLTPVDCMDLTIMMDMSGSIMNLHNENRAKNELQKAFSKIKDKYNGQHFALVQFADDASVVFELGNHLKSFIDDEISTKVQRGGWTATAKAFQIVKDNIYRGSSADRGNGKNVVAILTDGHPTMSLNFSRIRETAERELRRYIEDEAEEEARRLKSQDGATILAVLVDGSHRQNKDFLDKVVTDRNNHIREVNDFNQVGDAVIGLISNLNIKVDSCV